MALSLINSRRTFNVLKLLSSPFVKQCHWFPHYQPGPYPTTEKERIEAAKKYNLLPEEYKPIDSQLDPIGDYPDLPLEAVASKDPYYNWDYPEMRRDYNEPVPRDFIIMLPLNWGEKPIYDRKEAILQVISILVGYILIMYYIFRYKLCLPTLEKQLIKSGETHYTFELDHSKPITTQKGPNKIKPSPKTK